MGCAGRSSRTTGSTKRVERTLYRGEHYVECYLVQNGRCVARAREWVPIS